MESSPLARYIPQKSKKRVFPGGSSSYVEPEVVEIAPPISWSSKSKSLTQKEVIRHEIIDVDTDEDCTNVMLIEGKIDTNNKGKEAFINSSSNPCTTTNLGLVDGAQSSKKTNAPGLHSILNLDGSASTFPYGDDEYMDMYYDDLMYDDEYAILQSHFDNMDIPPGVEAPIPWLSVPAPNKLNPPASSSTYSTLQIHSDAEGFPSEPDLSHSSRSPKPAQTKEKSTSKSISSLQTQVHGLKYPHMLEPSISMAFGKRAQSRRKLAASSSSTHSSLQHQKGVVNLPSGLEPFKSWRFDELSDSKRKPPVHSSTDCFSSHNQFHSVGGSYFFNNTKKEVDDCNLTYSSFHTPMDTMNLPAGVDASISSWQQSYPEFDPLDAVHFFPGEETYAPWIQDPGKSQHSATASGSSTINGDEILEKLNFFKKFDTVQNHSDHYYSRSGSSVMQPLKNWAKKIQEEWKILEKDLPDTIFVRVYESRMDLLSAVIVGAEGTPYHDGLFFFDVFFPSSYPNVPPHVHYHSGGLRINPNLYKCGKVCLSLLNTWSGNQREKWIPGVSTMLQVLVSIQGLILNAKPFFNEPGYENMAGFAGGEKSSLLYNEKTFILSLKTMLYTIRKPPKHFEDFVFGHFYKYAYDILVACKAYMDGGQVGCLVKGGVQDVDEGNKSCSQTFKDPLMWLTNSLVEAFTQIGVKDCEKFLCPAQTRNRVVAADDLD